MQTFECPFGNFQLRRFPLRRRETLRAWDAADEYLLSELANGVSGRVLILNDRFGALSCALAGHRPVMQSDSYLSTWSSRENLVANGIDPHSVSLVDSLTPHQSDYDLVLVRVTKTLALLEDELIRLRPHLKPETRVIGAGMVKQIHRSTLELFEKIIGPTHTSLARKKARLIHATPDLSRPVPVSPYPVRYRLEGDDLELVNHANVFSRDRLDIGTRLFIQHIPTDPALRDIVDLGCGNGVVGTLAARANPGASIHFLDESVMALASARATYRGAGLANPASFTLGDALGGLEQGSADLILCNPPFHQGQVVGDEIAWRMFSQSRRALRPGGELRIVGNRHLNYHVKLKRLFGNVKQVAANRKFVVLSAWRRDRRSRPSLAFAAYVPPRT
ncbi:MAG: methyltransferase [Sedimenticola sp.]|nr:methyltransferase [Sedimenticola sp.]